MYKSDAERRGDVPDIQRFMMEVHDVGERDKNDDSSNQLNEVNKNNIML